MSVEKNKASVRSWNEALNSPDWETSLRPFFSDQVVWEEWRAQHRKFRDAFPDYHFEVDGMIGEGDQVAAWGNVTGTFTRPYDEGGLAGIEPRGQKLEWREVMVVDFSGEEPDAWVMVDELSRMRQLGALE